MKETGGDKNIKKKIFYFAHLAKKQSKYQEEIQSKKEHTPVRGN